ncbi:MAG: hypothetical protein AB8B85_04595, partial [Paracoccaceae bacterium]
TSFGLAPSKGEGGPITYDDHSQTNVAKFLHAVYGLGYKVTREEGEDNKYAELSRARSASLSFSMRQTKETVHANIFNRAFNASYAGADGKELLATDHPTRAGDQANELAVAADLSEASIEDMLIQIRNAKNSRGLKINLIGKKLIVHPNDMFEAKRILGSTLRSGTDHNDTNALREMGMLPEGVMVYDYLTDPDAFFIQTDAPAGLTSFTRRKIDLTQDNDFDTENMCAKATERYSMGWGDWRSLYGSPGAA